MSANGNAHMRDGAMYFVLPNNLKQCPHAGIVEALPDIGFKVAMDHADDMMSGIDVQFPSPWGAVSAKRSIAGRATMDAAPPKCDSKQYADTYVWGEGDSVYVLKGSEEVHAKLAAYHNVVGSKQSYTDFVRGLGATFYENCKSVHTCTLQAVF